MLNRSNDLSSQSPYRAKSTLDLLKAQNNPYLVPTPQAAGYSRRNVEPSPVDYSPNLSSARREAQRKKRELSPDYGQGVLDEDEQMRPPAGVPRSRNM